MFLLAAFLPAARRLVASVAQVLAAEGIARQARWLAARGRVSRGRAKALPRYSVFRRILRRAERQ